MFNKEHKGITCLQQPGALANQAVGLNRRGMRGMTIAIESRCHDWTLKMIERRISIFASRRHSAFYTVVWLEPSVCPLRPLREQAGWSAHMSGHWHANRQQIGKDEGWRDVGSRNNETIIQNITKAGCQYAKAIRWISSLHVGSILTGCQMHTVSNRQLRKAKGRRAIPRISKRKGLPQEYGCTICVWLGREDCERCGLMNAGEDGKNLSVFSAAKLTDI